MTYQTFAWYFIAIIIIRTLYLKTPKETMVIANHIKDNLVQNILSHTAYYHLMKKLLTIVFLAAGLTGYAQTVKQGPATILISPHQALSKNDTGFRKA
jgi:hypothetical protein